MKKEDKRVMRETIMIELKGSKFATIIVSAKYIIVNKNIYRYILLLLYLEATVESPIAKYTLLSGNRAISTKKAKS